MTKTLKRELSINNKIIVYGHADKSEYGFPTERDLIEYLQNKLFSRYSGRYHFTQNKKADIIIVLRDGFAYGHLNVEDIEDPTPRDKEEYPRVTRVYMIRSSAVYNKPVKLSDIGIRGLSFGKRITADQFDEIKGFANGIVEYPRP